MKFLSNRKSRITATVVALIVVGTGASGYVLYQRHKIASAATPVTPLSITPGPAGMIGGTTPNPSGGLWVLVNQNGKANVQLIYTSSKAPPLTYPVSGLATAVATNVNDTLAVGLGSSKVGAVQFYSTTGMAPMGSVPMPGPVTDLVGSGGGTTFYALVQVHGADSVNIVDSQSRKILGSIPVPSQTDAIAVSPDLSTIYTLQGSGTISIIDIASRQVTQSFAITPGDRQLAISPDGSTLYVLKGTLVSDNVAVINLATESTLYVLPAPSSCQSVVVSPQGNLYDLVATPQFGNVQVFRTTRSK
jgi:DNA-binding beta-propeller fold protein YncE